MPDVVQFVDAIGSSPTVRLDLNDDVTWSLDYRGTDLSPPPLKYAEANTLLTDGERRSASAYGNRSLKLALDLKTSTVDGQGTQLQKLWRELDRAKNLIKWQPNGTANPVFFRTLRSANNRIMDVPGLGDFRQLTVEVDAEPFAYGLKQSSAVTLWADPAEGVTLNSNWDFEVDDLNWTALGGTKARSLLQSHDGVASLLLTPDGVTATSEARAELVPATVALVYRGSAWVRCAVARNVSVNINWHASVGAGGALLSTSTATVAVAANTWTPIDLTATAPASTGQARLTVSMGTTPPAGNTLHIDRARIRLVNSLGGPAFDLTNVKGDVETPLVIAMTANSVTTGTDRNVVFATRRRGTPSAAPVVVQAESGGLGTDTTTQPNTVDASGSGNNFTRTTFATTIAMTTRLSWSPFPAAASLDARGQYRALLRCRQTIAGDSIKVRLGWGGVGLDTANVVPSGNWFWIDLGLISLPRGADPVYDGVSGVELAVSGTSLDVSAQRVSGTGGLDMDVLLLVPADDQWSTVFMPSTLSGSSVFDSIARQAYRLDASGAVAPTPFDVYSIPGGGSAIHASPGVTNRVYVVQGLAGADGSMTAPSTDTFTPLTVSYWPRYLHVAAP